MARIAFAGACVLCAPVLFGGLPLFFGASMWVIAASLGPMLVCVVLVVVRRVSRSPGA